jgi:hypothetical protein
MKAAPSWMVRVLHAVVRMFPADFRDRFGMGMEYALMREYEQSEQGGMLAMWRFFVRSFASLLAHGVMERLEKQAGDATSSATGSARRKRVAGVAATLFLPVVSASLVPATRAAGADPADAMRAE